MNGSGKCGLYSLFITVWKQWRTQVFVCILNEFSPKKNYITKPQPLQAWFLSVDSALKILGQWSIFTFFRVLFGVNPDESVLSIWIQCHGYQDDWKENLVLVCIPDLSILCIHFFHAGLDRNSLKYKKLIS
jgi:hypothetical protein